jgi:hypothetical protein
MSDVNDGDEDLRVVAEVHPLPVLIDGLPAHYGAVLLRRTSRGICGLMATPSATSPHLVLTAAGDPR